MLEKPTDEHFMKMALKEAEAALAMDEIPVGAVITIEGQIIARAHNYTERLHDFTAHAEMQAFTAASEFLNGKYLDKCTLYVTLEPCVMCAGAAFWTRVGRIVFGAHDEKRGFLTAAGKDVLHPKTKWSGGLMEEECRTLILDFFKKKRDGL